MYKFEKVNEDEYKLIADKQEFIFTRTVDIAKEIQSVDLLATIKVAEILETRGETYDNTKLRIEKTIGNKTIIDESNLKALERKARELALTDVLTKVYNKLFNMNPIELIQKIGIEITDIKSIEKFSSELTEILVNGISGNTPRGENA